MTREILEIVNGFRAKGIRITDEDIDFVYQYCYRKMEVAGIRNPEEYLPLLIEDEIKNFAIRHAVNEASKLLNTALEVM